MSVNTPLSVTELHAEEILKLEFEYARETATQAQSDRTVIVNLYLLLVGGAGSLLLAITSLFPSRPGEIPNTVFALLFFVTGCLGALTVFKLIRLRQAWHDSVVTMNRIKDYYLERFPTLAAALRWRSATIPPAGKAWSINFILALMVILLDSSAFAASVHLFQLRPGTAGLILDAIVLLLTGSLQVLFYFYELRPEEPPPVEQDANGEG